MKDLGHARTPVDEAVGDRAERLAGLRERAEAALADESGREATSGVAASWRDMAHVLEELRTYQVELELQNDELRAAQFEALVAHGRYVALFDHLPMAAWVVTPLGVATTANDLALDWFGLRAGLASFNLLMRFDRVDQPAVHAALAAMEVNRVQVLRGLRLAGPGGGGRVVDVHVVALPAEYHLDRHGLCVLIDRSAQTESERAKETFQTLVDRSDAPIYAMSREGVCLAANDATLRHLGRSRGEVVGHPRGDFMALHEAREHEATERAVLDAAETLTVEETLSRPGSAVPAHVVSCKFPLVDALGAVYGVGSVSTDVTELRSAQRFAWLSEAIFVNATEAIVVADADGSIVRMNEAFERLSSFSAASLVGKPLRALLPVREGVDEGPHPCDLATRDGRWCGELELRGADGQPFDVLATVTVLRDARGVVCNQVLVLTDLTELHDARSRVERLAYYDGLTGLPNRALLNDRLERLVARSVRRRGRFAVLFLDLDHFKVVNDTLGHVAGDGLLKEIAARLKECVRDGDTVARRGGNEFIVVLDDVAPEDAARVAAKIREVVAWPVKLAGHLSYQPHCTVGVALFPADGADVDTLLRNADAAMYAAKAAGRDRTQFFDAELGARNARQFAIETGLRHSLDTDGFVLHFQPKFCLEGRRFCGVEALVRWRRTPTEVVSPGEFLPVAERTGLMVRLDQWVLRAATATLRGWVAQGLWRPEWRVAINQTALSLRARTVASALGEALRDGVVGGLVEIELTETALLESTGAVLDELRAIEALGVQLSIDDFGTGYSSLAYLKNLPIAVLKIDQGFVRDMIDDASDRVLVNAMVHLAHDLGLHVVAEGVEHDAQAEALRALGCEMAQGYHFARPMPASELETRHLRPLAATEVPSAAGG